MKRTKGNMVTIINLTIYAATLGLLVWFCFGCTKSVPVPIDCQQFLDKYFEAVKSKDIGKIRDFSTYVSPVQSKDMPEAGMDMLRQTAGKFAVEGFERMNKELGDFKSYSVLSVKVTTIPTADPAANTMSAGIHAEIACKARFSEKKSVWIFLHLFKQTQESEYHILAWKYEVEL
jgi:hypothetical protein